MVRSPPLVFPSLPPFVRICEKLPRACAYYRPFFGRFSWETKNFLAHTRVTGPFLVNSVGKLPRVRAPFLVDSVGNPHF